MNKSLWLSSTKQILIGVKLYYICSIIATIFGLSFLSLVPVIGPIGKMAAGASVVGAFAFMYGVKAFKEAVDPADLPSVSKLYTSLILVICAIFIDVIPVIGWIVTPIVNLVAFIFMLLAYKGLKGSESFPSPAKEGAQKLFIAMIIACVSAVVSIIPVIGSIIAAVIDIVVLIFVLGGWSLIAAEQTAAEPKVITE
ncbi:MAG: hypothetical protein SNH13_01910 [Rikenellaceae bacterium]